MLRHQGEGATLSRILRETLNRQVILHSGKRVLGYRASEGETHVFAPGGMERRAVQDAADILGITTGAVRSRLSRGTLPPDAQRHAARDATAILGRTTGRCEAAYLAVRCPPTHSGMPYEMPPPCQVSLVVPHSALQ